MHRLSSGGGKDKRRRSPTSVAHFTGLDVVIRDGYCKISSNVKLFNTEEFEEYVEKAKTLPDTTTNESKLCLYGLYKQATVSPVNTGK